MTQFQLFVGMTLITSTLMSGSVAHAAGKTVTAVQIGTDKEIQFSLSDTSSEISMSKREKLKATTKTQGDFNLSNRVLLGDAPVTGIRGVEALAFETDIVEYKDGEDGVSHTRPGNHKPGKMTITRDWSNTSEFYKWRKAVLDGKVDRRSISVVIFSDAGDDVQRLELGGCLPTGLTVSADPLNEKAPRLELTTLDCLEVSAVLKTKHDTVKNSINNVR